MGEEARAREEEEAIELFLFTPPQHMSICASDTNIYGYFISLRVLKNFKPVHIETTKHLF